MALPHFLQNDNKLSNEMAYITIIYYNVLKFNLIKLHKNNPNLYLKYEEFSSPTKYLSLICA